MYDANEQRKQALHRRARHVRRMRPGVRVRQPKLVRGGVGRADGRQRHPRRLVGRGIRRVARHVDRDARRRISRGSASLFPSSLRSQSAAPARGVEQAKEAEAEHHRANDKIRCGSVQRQSSPCYRWPKSWGGAA